MCIRDRDFFYDDANYDWLNYGEEGITCEKSESGDYWVYKDNRSDAVSYTHLDVYKRQMSIRKIGDLYIGITGEAHVDPQWSYNSQGFNWKDQFYVNLGLYVSRDGIRFQRVGGPEPVSYTHLDVYKRQLENIVNQILFD